LTLGTAKKGPNTPSACRQNRKEETSCFFFFLIFLRVFLYYKVETQKKKEETERGSAQGKLFSSSTVNQYKFAKRARFHTVNRPKQATKKKS
jgi:hypothetical protein